MACGGELSPPLMCVVVVCRERPRVAALVHVVCSLSGFLDFSPLLRFDKACQSSSLYLMQRIVANNAQEPMDSSRRDFMYRQWQFSVGLPEAVATGNLRMAQWLLEHFRGCQMPSTIVGDAASLGRLEILEHLLAQGYDLLGRGDEVERALEANHTDVAVWLKESVPSSAGEATKAQWPVAAARNGNLRMVQWSIQQLKDSFTPDTEFMHAVHSAVDAATETGQRAILEWFLTDDEMATTIQVDMGKAAAGGHFELMQWIWWCYPMNVDVGDVVHEAAQNGRLDMIQWLHERNLGAPAFNSFDKAAANGHLEIVKWLHEHQSADYTEQAVSAAAKAGNLNEMGPLGYGAEAMNDAAAGGHLSVVQWLHENRTEGCTTEAMDSAAAGGHLEVVQWLSTHRLEGCTVSATNDAAENGHLAVVQWLHANRPEGCTRRAMNDAARCGHLEVVQWLHTYRSEGCTIAAMDRAAENGHLKVVEWLHNNRSEGCTILAMNGAAKDGHLEVIQWLHSNRREGCTTYAMDIAAERGDLRLVRWLHLNRHEGCTTRAMDRAAASGHFDVVLFLHQERTEGCSKDAVLGAQRSGFLSWFERYYPAQLLRSGAVCRQGRRFHRRDAAARRWQMLREIEWYQLRASNFKRSVAPSQVAGSASSRTSSGWEPVSGYEWSC